MRFLIPLIFILTLSSCFNDNSQPELKYSEEQVSIKPDSTSFEVQTDTIEIVLSDTTETDSSYLDPSIMVTLYPDEVIIESNDLTVRKKTEAGEFHVKYDKKGHITSWNTGVKSSSPRYKYVPAKNAIVVQQGNTLNSIARDNNKTVEQLLKCNPNIVNGKIRIGDVIALNCD